MGTEPTPPFRFTAVPGNHTSLEVRVSGWLIISAHRSVSGLKRSLSNCDNDAINKLMGIYGDRGVQIKGGIEKTTTQYLKVKIWNSTKPYFS